MRSMKLPPPPQPAAPSVPAGGTRCHIPDLMPKAAAMLPLKEMMETMTSLMGSEGLIINADVAYWVVCKVIKGKLFFWREKSGIWGRGCLGKANI